MFKHIIANNRAGGLAKVEARELIAVREP